MGDSLGVSLRALGMLRSLARILHVVAAPVDDRVALRVAVRLFPQIGGVVTPGQSAKQDVIVSGDSHLPSPQVGALLCA